MLQRSVSSGMRRQIALWRSCCAPLALALLIIGPHAIAWSEQPATTASSAASKTDTWTVPAPQPPSTPSPPTTTASPNDPQRPAGAPAATDPPAANSLPPLRPAKSNEARASRPSEDLDTALERPGDLNLHGLSLEAALFT